MEGPFLSNDPAESKGRLRSLCLELTERLKTSESDDCSVTINGPMRIASGRVPVALSAPPPVRPMCAIETLASWSVDWSVRGQEP